MPGGLKRPTASDLSRRYAEVLSDNLGQPGFRELVIAVHDVDAHRDLVFALVAESRRRDLYRRATSEARSQNREAASTRSIRSSGSVAA